MTHSYDTATKLHGIQPAFVCSALFASGERMKQHDELWDLAATVPTFSMETCDHLLLMIPDAQASAPNPKSLEPPDLVFMSRVEVLHGHSSAE